MTMTSEALSSLGQIAQSAANEYSTAPAFTVCMPNGMNGTLTFQMVDALSDAFAIYLREVVALKPGDRVAIQVPNSLSFPVAAFGVFKARCILVNVNPLYTSSEMALQFEDATPSAIVIADIFANKLPAATRNHAISNIIVTQVSEFMPYLPQKIIRLVQKHWDRSIRPISFSHTRLPDAIAAAQQSQQASKSLIAAYDAAAKGDATACLQYTGGTTGMPKGAMLTHNNLLANVAQTLAAIPSMAEEHQTILTALPLYHIFAFTVNLLSFFRLGAQNILIPNPRPLINLKRAFENYPITWMSGVNTLFNGLTRELWFQDNPPKKLKFATAGGMAMQTAVAECWHEVTQSPLLEGYGLTETSPVLSFNPLARNRAGSVGVPLSSTQIACIDDNGNLLPIGEIGEVVAKGPQVMQGYWQQPEETMATFHDGWLRTGDIGKLDQDGYLHIIDRKKDVIIVSGFNVYPNEIEDCLATLKGVSEAAVIGVKDADANEVVTAFVVRQEKTLTEATLLAHCQKYLTHYKIPKKFIFRNELPKSPVGKILRKDLRSTLITPSEPAV